MKNPKSILITGGSSGLGEAMAKDYATEGVTLFLSGRNEDRLKAVQAHCHALGAEAHIARVDTADETAMSDWIIACDKIAPLDLIIANAGIGLGYTKDMI